jgi:hypothetical protein
MLRPGSCSSAYPFPAAESSSGTSTRACADIMPHCAPPVGNAFRQGFYWPAAVADANEVVRTSEGCQFYTRKTHLPAHALQTIPVTWSFAVWGLDIVRPL